MKLKEIRASLLKWYDVNRRDIPWRRINDSDDGERDRKSYDVWLKVPSRRLMRCGQDWVITEGQSPIYSFPFHYLLLLRYFFHNQEEGRRRLISYQESVRGNSKDICESAY
ncbi:hypothetical protein L2E82_17476 [Cichorium intybus]|uniref:Uncharacterized protein n=1 Tax=Cichorium intybus TaxID=13427 RepID=A0ACB9F7V2_CICIN|nr:hypothetical protein L2E82_17476 [Cichorium intybus]